VEKEKRVEQTTKEVQRYAVALNERFNRIRKGGLIRIKDIIAIQETLEDNDAGVRSLPGTKLTNPATGEIMFVPPQHKDVILKALENLEQFINNDELSDAHPLITMAIIHVQFESIHPFYDGNGRIGGTSLICWSVKSGSLIILKQHRC